MSSIVGLAPDEVGASPFGGTATRKSGRTWRLCFSFSAPVVSLRVGPDLLDGRCGQGIPERPGHTARTASTNGRGALQRARPHRPYVRSRLQPCGSRPQLRRSRPKGRGAEEETGVCIGVRAHDDDRPTQRRNGDESPTPDERCRHKHRGDHDGVNVIRHASAFAFTTALLVFGGSSRRSTICPRSRRRSRAALVRSGQLQRTYARVCRSSSACRSTILSLSPEMKILNASLRGMVAEGRLRELDLLMPVEELERAIAATLAKLPA
jgi:hypothetical protein